MSKIKKVWNENKILFVLGLILLICIIVVAVVSLTFFYGSSDNPYGNRLDITEKVPLDEKFFNEIKEKLESNAEVKKVDVIQKVKGPYVSITYADDTKMDKAKEIAASIIDLFTEEELAVYDIEFTITANITTDKNNSKYTLMGARNSSGSGEIIWNNYNIKTEEESKEE